MTRINKIIIPILAVFFVFLVGRFSYYFFTNKKTSSPITKQLINNFLKENKPYVIIDQIKMYIEIADTDIERQLGLSTKEGLKDNEGMLFIFNQQDIRPAFWMKNMKFPIDIIWINDGKIVQIDHNVPIPEANTPESELALYKTTKGIDYVLEVKSGFTKTNSIEVGNTIDLNNALPN